MEPTEQELRVGQQMVRNMDEQYGKRMQLRAREVRFQPVAPEQFVIPADYIPLDARAMKSQLEKVVDEFMSN
jgi:hypothetical protein